MYKFLIAILFLLVSVSAVAQKMSIEDYIEQYKGIAMSEMKRSGIPASITLAQGILESENGNGDLVKRSNNHFGIKCKSTWTGESVFHDDDENGECFRAYINAEDSYRDHSDFLRANKRYEFLFRMDGTDYKGWARGLKRAGYATNPRYPELLIKYIEQYNLQQYSLVVLNDLLKEDVSKINEAGENIFPADTIKEKGIGSNENDDVSIVSGNVIQINKTNCVFVKKGTSLLAVALQHHISLNKLMEFNDLVEDGLVSKDQYIFLHKKMKTGEKDYYIVQPGETLYDAAQKNGIQLRYLKEYNNLNNDEMITGETKLFLQPGLKSLYSNTEQNKNIIHLVAPKEGLYAIARKYNVTVKQLREWNKLDTDELVIGQEIIVSK